MPIALVANADVSGVGGGTTGAVNTTGATLLVVFHVEDGDGTNADISDSKSNTWTPLTVRVGSWLGGRAWYVANPTVGTGHTFTANGAFFISACFAAFSGVVTTSPFDQQNGLGSSGVDNTTAQPGSITPSENDELIISGIGHDEVTVDGINSAMTITDTAPYSGGVNYGAALAYKVQTTAAAINPLWNVSGTTPAAIVIASFKAEADAGTDVSAATVELTVDVPSPTVTASASVPAGSVTVVVEVPTPAITATAAASPGTVEVVVEVPAPTVTTTGAVTAATVDIVVDVPTPAVETGESATATPGTVELAVDIPTPTITATATVTASTVDLSVEVPSPTLTATAVVTPSTVELTIDIPTPTVTATAVVAAGEVLIAVEVSTPTITATGAASPSTVEVVVEVPTPTVAGLLASAATVELTIEIPEATIVITAPPMVEGGGATSARTRDWGGLGAILRAAREDRIREAAPAVACPICGTPLQTNSQGIRNCPMGHYRWPPAGVPTGPRHTEPTPGPPVACPHDGSPLQVNSSGQRSCPFGDFTWP